MTKSIIRTTAGAPWVDNQNSKSAGKRGPLLLEDYQLLEKLAHQNRERIPERTVHAKGSGAYGTLTITRDITRYTKASVFSKIGQKTDMFARFSIALAQKGAAETGRDIRGMAMKFYTEEGNWDLICNNSPVFFVRDPIKFPDFIHSERPHPKTNMPSPTAIWDFLSLNPECVHETLILFSDRGIPQNYRHMDSFGCHTYSLWNEKGERYWVKFHFKTQQGNAFYTAEEAAAVAAKNPASSHSDLYAAIEKGDYPRWTLSIQIMEEAEAEHVSFNPFDVTRVWSHKDYPLIEVGVLELNRNPENYFAEVEQAAFSPANVIPGIGYSPDRMLQGRLFTYQDAHFYRVGTNYEMLPVNRPKFPVKNYHLDGAMRFDSPDKGDGDFYEPNSFGGPVGDKKEAEPPLRVSGEAAYYDHRNEGHDYEQGAGFYSLLSDDEKQRLYQNLAMAMKEVPQLIVDRQLGHFEKVNPELSEGVKKALSVLSG